MPSYEIGRLLRAGTTGFIAGCSVSQFDTPAFGALVRAPLGNGYQVYGLIYDIHIDDDGLVRQLVTAENVSAEVMKDNRERRIVPVEMSVLSVGYEQDQFGCDLPVRRQRPGAVYFRWQIRLLPSHSARQRCTDW
jgi:hypothetical protein